jgi:hypothetical protein
VVEQGTHKPLVGSSNLPPGTDLGLHSAWVERPPLHWIFVDLDTRSHNISAVTQQRQSVSERNLRLWQKKK